MTTVPTKETLSPKPKHTALPRPVLGTFGRLELAMLGTACGEIKQLAQAIISRLGDQFRIAYVDADHKGEEGPKNPFLQAGAALHYNDKISAKRLEYQTGFNEYQIKSFFAQQDLVLINGNHFAGRSQVVVIDPLNPLEKKLDQLTDVRLVLLKEGVTEIPASVAQQLGEAKNVPVLRLAEVDQIAAWVADWTKKHVPVLHGLVLAGGLSTRMQQDKGLLQYHGKPQREYAYELLRECCAEVYLSCRPDQVTELAGQFNAIPDTFLGLGPKGGILSAFRHNPDAAWLVLACDLPYLNRATLQHLVQQRNPGRVATAFLDSEGQFPEPLVAIYEPRSYSLLLQMLGLGYACPRKTLINADAALVTPPDARALTNVNDPGAYEAALKALRDS